MPLISLDKVSLAYGHVPLLDHAELHIEPRERVCLVGRNGAGKSSLMGLVTGRVQPDDGGVWRQPGLRLAHLAQEVPQADRRTVFDVVADGLGESARLVTAYHHTAMQLAVQGSEALTVRLAELQHALEAVDGWRLEQRVETVLSRLELPADCAMDELSGGAKRRVLLARALVGEPGLLLLDEPTNHLDIDSIAWLEEFLLGFGGALLFITHDRTFLQRLATRIVELDRGRLSSWPGDYAQYLRKKEERLAVEAEHNAKFDRKLAQEEAWIRQGIKARRTRNEGRVRALKTLRAERAQRRERPGDASLALDRGEASGKLVLEAQGVTLSYGGKPVIRDFSTRIVRGDRIGVIGPNGCGKSTLIKLLLGELQADHGTVRLGTRVQVAYFDQQRAQLDPEASVIDSVSGGEQTVTVNGRPLHAISYLRNFLFPPERARSPVKSLSGGERNRLLLARLFARPANLLVLDEPTNDLDVETLELLEELLADYGGTLLLVSHDRAFLDNVVTSTLVFEGDGRIGEYVGGYEDWLRQRGSPAADETARKDSARRSEKSAPAKAAKGRKRGYKEQRELDALPARIERLEAEQAELQARAADPGFYRRGGDEIAAHLARLEEIEGELAQAYGRWEELDAT